MFSFLLDRMIEGCQIIDHGWRYLYLNDAAAGHARRAKSDLIGRRMMDVFPGIEKTPMFERLAECMASRASATMVNEFTDADGSVAWFEHRFQPVSEGMLVTSLDITERKQTEEALRVSLRFLETVHKHTEMTPMLEDFVSEIQRHTGCDSVGIRMLDEEGGIPYRAYAGFSPEFYDMENPLSVNSDRCMCINVIKGTVDPELPFYTKGGSFYINGTSRFLALVSEEEKGETRNTCNREGYESVALVPFRRGDRILGLIHVADYRENMVPLKVVEMLERAAMQLGTAFERVRAEEAVKDSEKKYRTLVNNALVGIYRSDPAGRFLYVNDALVKIFECDSVEEVLATPVIIRYKRPQDREKILEGLRQKGKVPYHEFEVTTKTGGFKCVAISALLDGDVISGMVVDITEQKRLEEQLRQSQKMEAIGQLTGGIAHDFNNILTAIIGYATILQIKLKEDDPLQLDVEQILASAERAATLTQSLLAFGRKQIMSPQPVDLNEILKGLSKLLPHLIGENIELRTILTEGCLTVMADSGRIEQVLMHLATNARDAMPKGGVLSIETKAVRITEDFARARGYGEPGSYALFTVTDTGSGMDETTREKIFDPFFTTKEVGKGTGLGLSVVYGIIKQHNGYIDVRSEVGRGTTFKIYLPLTGGEAKIEKPAGPAAPFRGAEAVLLAEDEAAVRQLLRAVLDEFGYTVIEASDGEDAIEKFIANKDKIRLLILDVVMPGKDGKEVYESARKLKPEVKALFMSGYTADVIQMKAVVEEGLHFVMKPVSPADFLTKVREVLEK